MSLPNDVELTRPQYVGAKVTRREDPRLLSGEGNYVADIKRHGMLHIAFRRSDQAHALIHKIDIGEVLSLPGVIGVYTGKDIAEIAKPYKAIADEELPGYLHPAVGDRQGALCGRGGCRSR